MPFAAQQMLLRFKTKEEVDRNVSLITIPNENGVGQEDLIIAYQTIASNGDIYAGFYQCRYRGA